MAILKAVKIPSLKREHPVSGVMRAMAAGIESQGTGVGIRGMRERVRHFLGDLVIESNGSGTKIFATLPLKIPLLTPQGATFSNDVACVRQQR